MKDPNIIQITEELNRRYNPDNLSPFPFDKLDKDIEELRIFLADELPDQVSGGIRFNKKDKTYEILVSKEKSPTRQHFTLAHETGHFFLHKNLIKSQEVMVDIGDPVFPESTVLFRSDNPQKQGMIEKDANVFAANLVMPKDLVIKAWNELKNIEECASIFHVSPLAMTIRLQELNLVE